jgi:hypothetical protein
LKIWPIIWASIILRLAYAFWNGFYGPAPGADGDALVFFDDASSIADGSIDFEWAIGPKFYVNFLGTIFYLFGSSIFLASLVSVFAWSLSVLFLYKCFKILRPEANHNLPLLIYSFLPFGIVYSSIQLREPFQLLFVNCIAFGAIVILKLQAKWGWIFLLAGCLGAGCLHGSLTAFAGVSFLAVVAYPILTKSNRLNFLQIVVSTILISFILVYGLSFFSTVSYNLSGGATDALKTYQEGGLLTEARANYKLEAVGGSFTEVTASLVSGVFQYFMEPFPWNIDSLADALLFFENLVRIFCLFACFTQLRNRGLRDRPLLILFVSLFLFVEGVWSIGTINWGTASRHHFPSIGLLIIAYSITPKKSSLQKFKNREFAMR